LRYESPPEGARNLQECLRHTKEHKWPQGCTGFHRDLNFFCTKERKGGSTASQHCLRTGEKGRGESCSPRGKSTGEVAGAQRGRWPPVEIAGGGEIAAGQRAAGGWEIKQSLWLGRAGGRFLKREMGTPDSLQCLSGAHRTAHSSCPVNHRTAHRKIGF
jgi:hypothetical protein